METKVYDTLYETQDIVIADMSVKDFGAVGDGVKDDTQAFKDALTTAGNRGGGVVFVPDGRYKITDSLLIPTGVTLRGDWANPEQENGLVKGTILQAYSGRGNADEASFLQMAPSSGVMNLSVWYPEQSLNAPVAYPWTFEQLTGDSATIKNVTLVNSYNGIKIGPVWNELHYVRNLYGTALHTGIFLDFTTDIGRLEHIRLSPDYWANSGLAGAPQQSALYNYMIEHAEGIVMGRSDWEYMSDIAIDGFKNGMRITTRTESNEAANAQLYRIHIEDCNVALKIEGVNSYGLLITDSSFKAGAGSNPIAIYVTEGFSTIAQFNKVTVGGNPKHAVYNEGTGVLSFENSRFENWNDKAGGYAYVAKGGSVIFGQTTFDKAEHHVLLEDDAEAIKAVNSGYNGKLDITDKSAAAKLDVFTDTRYVLEPLPASPALDVALKPKPSTDLLFNVLTYGAKPNDTSADYSKEIQAALDDAKTAGGGTVYLPAGIYNVNQKLTIPGGVELRGNFDVPHHTVGNGTVLFTNYGLNDENGAPFIALEANAGIKGLSIYYNQQSWDVVKPYSWTIQGQGYGVYVIDTTLINSFKGIDFGTYDTSGHYIDYVAGSPLKEGIFLGGGAEKGLMRNVQFNPHYYGRNNYPNHPSTSADFDKVWSYQKENLDAFRIGEVSGQTIFNTFVFGSQYGIHFEEQNGKGPEAIVVGHGTDGSKKGVVLDSAGPAGLHFINTELVSMSTTDKVYVLVGEQFDAKATFFNTSMWGDTTRSLDIYSGDIRIQQANFERVGVTGINAIGGDITLYNSYFQQTQTDHIYASSGIEKLLVSNNIFKGGLQMKSEAVGKVSGTDLVPVALGIKRSEFDSANLADTKTVLTLTNMTDEAPINGRIELVAPQSYASVLKPIRLKDLALSKVLEIPLPFLSSDTLTYKVTLDSGYSFTTSVNLGQSFASRNDSNAGSHPDIQITERE